MGGLITLAVACYKVVKYMSLMEASVAQINTVKQQLDDIDKKVDEIESIVKLSATTTIADRTLELGDAIELEKKKKQVITELLNQPFYECDENGYATSLNDSLLSVFGMERETAIGYGWLNAISEGHNTRVKEEWENAIKHNAIEFETVYRVKKDGRMYKTTAKILRDSKGGIKFIFGTVTLYEKQ